MLRHLTVITLFKVCVHTCDGCRNMHTHRRSTHKHARTATPHIGHNLFSSAWNIQSISFCLKMRKAVSVTPLQVPFPACFFPYFLLFFLLSSITVYSISGPGFPIYDCLLSVSQTASWLGWGVCVCVCLSVYMGIWGWRWIGGGGSSK